MAKLNDKKIKWIINKHLAGWNSVRISTVQGVSSSRVRQIICRYRRQGSPPVLKSAGRRPKPLNPEIINTVLEEYANKKVGPVALEKEIYRSRKIHIPHNTIYRIMAGRGLIRPNPNKRKQRKYVRFERKHSNSLWQGDWKHIVINGKPQWLVAFMDDASRLITCYGIYDCPTTENTIKTLLKGFAKYGKPRQILTDHGTQFYAARINKKGKNRHAFQEFLKKHNIEHILARVKHPQTNGKIERWFGLIEQKKHLFEDIHELVKWYNEIKPHMSLWFEYAEKPIEAFYRKLRPEVMLGLFFKNFEG